MTGRERDAAQEDAVPAVRRAGMSLRELAVDLWGRERVDAGWRADSPLRATLRRMLRRAGARSGAGRRRRGVSRGGTAERDAVLGAHAWAYLRRDPVYRAAWEAHAGEPRFEEADIPVRVQTGADLLAEADWGLLAWEDPGPEAWRSPFWSGVPMLVGEPDPDPWPDPAPLLGLLAGAGARVEGLRLLNGRFVLKAELGNALLQILVPSGRTFGPGDGIMAKLGLPLPLEAVVARIGDLWRVAGRLPPPRSRRVRARSTTSF